MEDLSLHILDIIENSINAGAKRIELTIKEDAKKNIFMIKIKDDGKGMSKDTINKALDPFFTTKENKRIGLGLSLLAQATEEVQGNFKIHSKEGSGTTICAKFIYDHMDRKPLGDIAETIITLIASHGHTIDFLYKHQKHNHSFLLDTISIKKELGDLAIDDPEVLELIRNRINEELIVNK